MKRAIMLLLVAAAAYAGGPPITHETLPSGRTYWLLVPPKATSAAPLVVLLHGSGHDGRLLVEHWAGLAAKEGIILAGPDAVQHIGWSFPVDGPNFLRDVVEAVKARAPVDPKRVYLFGHSAGAKFGTQMALIESEYFAAMVANAGGMPPTDDNLLRYATRRIPVLLIAGRKDFANVSEARTTHDRLQQAEFPVQYVEIPYGTHNYYVDSRHINDLAWKFLAGKSLSAEPKFADYANTQ